MSFTIASNDKEKTKYTLNLNQNFSLLIYFFLIIFARFNFNSSMVSSALLIFSLFVITFINTKQAFLCFIFQLFISDSLTIFSVISYPFLVDLIFIVKCVLNKKIKINNLNKIMFAIIIVLGQMISVITYLNDIKEVISLFLNIILFIIISENYEKIVNEKSMIVTTVFSVLSGALLGLLLDSRQYDWQRFSGIWNDQNFLGLYCLIAIIFCVLLILKEKKILSLIFYLTSSVVLFYVVTLSLSRTFIFALFIVSMFFIVDLFKSRKINSTYKLVIFLIGLVAAYFVINYVFSAIISTRGIVSDRGDWTNNRLLYTRNAFISFFNNPLSWIFGAGVNNVPRFVTLSGFSMHATHNTYADLFIQFGVLQGLFILFYILRLFVKLLKISDIFCMEKWMAIVVLFYMATLTMTHYEIFYVVIGLMEGRLMYEKKKSFSVLSDRI